MKATKITHRREVRIRVDFPYNAQATVRLKQIPDTRWSQTLKVWHIPYTKEAFEQLKTLFPEVEYEKSIPTEKPIIKNALIKTSKSTELSPSNKQTGKTELQKPNLVLQKQKTSKEPEHETETTVATAKPVEVSIAVTSKRIFVQLPKNDTDTQFLSSFRYVHWDNNNRQWIIPNYGKNLDLLKSYFQNRTVAITEQRDEKITEAKTTVAEAGTVKTLNIQNRILRVYFAYNRTLINSIKTLSLCRWNSSENCWTVPFNEINLEKLRGIANAHGLKYANEVISKTEGTPRLPKHANYLRCPKEYTEKLKELRYSINTLNVYTDLFEEFINYYPNKPAQDITEEEIITFLRYLVNDRKISTSYQNQSINAIHPVGF
ncbi:MAG: phage integrase N-terminal SAM-like domain-containing protein [Paludibacter sp.]|nr:phage integrase N-terminal SAM-like domain-containing protein [Paludibacter sp.]